MPPTHAIISTSHIGHSPSLRAPDEPLDLYAHLETKVELVQALRLSLDAWGEGGENRPILALMGHSVGAWLLCEIAKRNPSAVDAGYLLFPTLGWLAETWNGRTLWVNIEYTIKSVLIKEIYSQYSAEPFDPLYLAYHSFFGLSCRSHLSLLLPYLSFGRRRSYGIVSLWELLR